MASADARRTPSRALSATSFLPKMRAGHAAAFASSPSAPQSTRHGADIALRNRPTRRSDAPHHRTRSPQKRPRHSVAADRPDSVPAGRDPADAEQAVEAEVTQPSKTPPYA